MIQNCVLLNTHDNRLDGCRLLRTFTKLLELAFLLCAVLTHHLHSFLTDWLVGLSLVVANNSLSHYITRNGRYVSSGIPRYCVCRTPSLFVFPLSPRFWPKRRRNVFLCSLYTQCLRHISPWMRNQTRY